MITVNSNQVLQSTLTGEQTEFKIAATGKAFKILSTNIYKNKISSIVRELSCNAVDSHIALGVRDEIVISLPTRNNLEFSVEDFGVGLSDEEIREIYTTYFSSTKTTSNELIGGFGLGSKTPFAYTDAFTVRGRKDGIENTYVCTISDGGMPVLNKLISIPTTERNGVKVTVPLKSESDIMEFVDATYYLKWLDMPFKILRGNDELTLGYMTNEERLSMIAELKRDNYYIRKDGVGQCYFIIGGIFYPIPKTMSSNYEFLSNMIMDLYINVPIGLIDLTAGREDISMDVETIKEINKLLGKYDKLLSDDLAEKRKKSNTYIDYLKYAIGRVLFHDVIHDCTKDLTDLDYSFLCQRSKAISYVNKRRIKLNDFQKRKDFDNTCVKIFTECENVIFVERDILPSHQNIRELDIMGSDWWHKNYADWNIIFGDKKILPEIRKVFPIGKVLTWKELLSELDVTKSNKIKAKRVQGSITIDDVSYTYQELIDGNVYMISKSQFNLWIDNKDVKFKIISNLRQNEMVKYMVVSKYQLDMCVKNGVKSISDFDLKSIPENVYQDLFLSDIKNELRDYNTIIGLLLERAKAENHQIYDWLVRNAQDYHASEMISALSHLDNRLYYQSLMKTINKRANYSYRDKFLIVNYLEENGVISNGIQSESKKVADVVYNLLQDELNCDKLRIIYAGYRSRDERLVNIGVNYGKN